MGEQNGGINLSSSCTTTCVIYSYIRIFKYLYVKIFYMHKEVDQIGKIEMINQVMVAAPLYPNLTSFIKL